MLVLAYHGCDKAIAKDILTGNLVDLEKSTNAYDWLGEGIYFWENNYHRALEWATLRKEQGIARIKDPFVIGAVVHIHNVLDLSNADALELVKNAHQVYIDVCELLDENLRKIKI